MADKPKLKQLLTDIAQAINDKGVPGKMTAYEMPERISRIQMGIQPSGNIELKQPSATNVADYATATVKTGGAGISDTTITQNPAITVSQAGLITASYSASKQIQPNITAGWVDSGTPGTISTTGSSTQQLTTQAAKTITPNDSSQTAAAEGVFTTGVVTVQPVPTETKTVTENGTVTAATGKYFKSVVVNVPTHAMYTYRTGTGIPANSLGENGDVYFDLS